MRKEKSQRKDRLITIRFNEDVLDNIDRLASDNRITRSDIIRMAIDNSLERHLRHVRYVDPEQGEVINNSITRLTNEMGETLYNLRRIGTNFDQLLHKVNLAQVAVLQARGDLITRKELDAIVEKLENAIQNVGDEIYVFSN